MSSPTKFDAWCVRTGKRTANLARELNVSYQAVRNWRLGLRAPQGDSLAALRRMTGLTSADFEKPTQC